jgi:hypothetical protein
MKYFICKNPDIASLVSYIPISNVLDWSIFSLDDTDDRGIHTLKNQIELSEDDAIFGFRSFGDVRKSIKVSAPDLSLNEEFDETNYLKYSTVGSKVEIPITSKRYNCILNAMKIAAKVIIEDVFNERYIALDSSVSDIERKCWEYFVDELDKENYSFIAEIARIKNINLENYINTIRVKKSHYDSTVKNLYLSMTELKTEFNSCSTVRQLNRLYEDYMGIPMPQQQALEEGRTEITEGGLTRKSVVPGLKF